MSERHYYVYILTNDRCTVLYIGLTGNLRRRMEEHLAGRGGRFASKYNLRRLVHTEQFSTIQEAAERERQLKAGSRRKKIDLIEAENKEWKDLIVLL